MAALVYFGANLFGHMLLRRFERPDIPDIIDILFKFMNPPNPTPAQYETLSRYFADAYNEYLQRRNEFWTLYGQIIIAVLIVIVLTILLLTRSITAEAGLPILSGVSGFAIAKRVSTGRSPTLPTEWPGGTSS